MRSLSYTVLLSLILFALLLNALALFTSPGRVEAQSGNADGFYFEPGVYMLRLPGGGQVLGKVATNLRTGRVWGFPTNTSDPYPMSPIETKPQVSHPVPLGSFALAEASQ